MLAYQVVKRILSILKNTPDRKPKTAIYCTKSADIDNLGQYVNKYLSDESYVSNGAYIFDYDKSDVYFEASPKYDVFKSVIAKDYKVIFMIVGDESDEIINIIHSLDDSNNSVFIEIDYRLKAYQLLDLSRQPSKLLKRKSS